MSLAYVVTLYKQPEQFARLMDAIWHPKDLFAVHIDAKTPDDLRARFMAVAAGRPNVHFVDPVRVTWGGFGLCEAELRCLRRLVELGGTWGWAMNITGQDFPIRRRDEMLAELVRRPGANYMQVRDVRKLPFHFRRRAHWLCVERRDKIYRLPIPYPPPLRFRNRWYGVGFHVLSREFCEWLAATPLMESCRRYFRHTWHPHEHWLQAMIMASPFRDTVVPDNKRFIRWTRGSGNPKVLTLDHLPEMLSSSAFFARKFDESVDAEVLIALESRLRATAAA